MSLILDALKRAERERHSERSAALHDLPGAQSARVPRRWGRWLALAVLALAIGAVMWTARTRPKRVDTAAAAPAAEPAPAPESAPAPEPEVMAPASIPARPAPTPAPIPGTESVSSLDDLTTETDIALEPAADPDPPPAPPLAAGVKPQPQAPVIASAPKTPPPAEVDVDEAAPEPEAQPTPPLQNATPTSSATEAAPTSAVPPALTQPAPLRRFREMPPDYRADFPALTVEVHVFERIASQRFVLVNGRRYRQGERMVEGPQVLEIVQEGIVLEYRGEKLLYTLGR
ncbi:MAG TPA: general secretion pathway protein GspB [Verrucomicrobiae bacterium]|nr:general secretion pathway protein GspB [Verrucomicrobiae bacterium]